MINGRGQTFRGGTNIVDVRDVAEIHAVAVETARPGHRYIASGTNVEWKSIGKILYKITGIKPMHLGLKRRPMKVIAGIAEAGAKILGSPSS